MQAIKSSRWQILAAGIVVFALGILVGALGTNLYHRRGPTSQYAGRREAFAQAVKQLDLNSEQQAKVDAILEDTRSQLRDVRKEESPKVSDIRKKARERLQSVLTPEQWRQLQEKMKSYAGQSERATRPKDNED